MNADLVLQLMLAAMNHANELGALFGRAKAEGRDITDAELAAVRQGAVDANQRLADAIAARAGG